MEKFLKDKFYYYFNTYKNNSNGKENFQLVEKKRKIYYFSKFSLDIDEFIIIYEMIKNIKENVSRNLFENIKICIQGMI